MPKPPKNFEVEADSSTEIVIQWQPVKLAKYYQIEMKYPNKQTKKIKQKAAFTLISIGDLQSGTEYSFRIQTITLTGYSDFTEFITVKTKSSGKSEILHCVLYISDVRI